MFSSLRVETTAHIELQHFHQTCSAGNVSCCKTWRSLFFLFLGFDIIEFTLWAGHYRDWRTGTVLGLHYDSDILFLDYWNEDG